MKAWLGAAALGLSVTAVSLAAVAQPPPRAPRIADERVLLRTTRGDLVVGLFPDVAPKHVAQILKLVRLGVYDSTWFYRIEPGFVVQLTDAGNRRLPLSSEQRAALQNLPAEFSSLPHLPGVLSMARQDADVNSGESSFSLLLAPAPHLDGKYTVFGKLLWGNDVLAAIAAVPRDAHNKPLEDIIVQAATVKTAPEIERMQAVGELRTALPYQGATSGAQPGVASPPSVIVNVGVALMIALSLAGFFLAGRVPPHRVSAFNILTVLVGAFLLLREWVPRVGTDGLLATTLFFATIALFKLMNRFESAGRPPPPTGGRQPS